jgi:hypothetical protein
MLIKANKREEQEEEEEEEEEEEDGWRREYWRFGEGGMFEMKKVTENEKRIYKRGTDEEMPSRAFRRRSEILWKFFHLSPLS